MSSHITWHIITDDLQTLLRLSHDYYSQNYDFKNFLIDVQRVRNHHRHWAQYLFSTAYKFISSVSSEFARISLSKNRVLKLFDVVNQFCIKMLIDLDVAKLEKRLTKQIHCMQRDIIIFVIKKIFVLKIDSTRQQEETISTMMNDLFATNLNLMMKYISKSILAHLRSQISQQMIAAMNDVINKTSSITSTFVSIVEFFVLSHVLMLSNRVWMSKVIVFAHLKSENVKLFVDKKKNAVFLRRFFSWIKMFDFDARVQTKTHEVQMHSIRIKNVNLKNSKDNFQTIEILITTNAIRISKLITNEIVYMRWIKKIRFEKSEQISVMLKFIFFETVNAIIRRSLVWDDETHICERLIRNCKIKQCFNCWIYDHIKIQCFLIIKCRRCANQNTSKAVAIFSASKRNASCVKIRIMLKAIYAVIERKRWKEWKRHEPRSMFFLTFSSKHEKDSSRRWFSRSSRSHLFSAA